MPRLHASAALGAVLLVAVLTGAPAGPARAHNRSMSWSTWSLDDTGARVELRLKAIELTREPPGHPWTRTLPEALQLSVNGEPCPASEALRAPVEPEGWAVFHWRIRCASSGPRSIHSRLLADVAPGHTHFARVETVANGAGSSMREHVLVSDRDPTWELDGPGAATGPPPSTLGSFVALGIEHIATGWDHMAFVLALLLLAGSLREVTVLVTGFTLAHSLTLALAVLGVVRPEAAAVEVLIGFSIALVAVENAWLLAGRPRVVPLAAGAALLACALAAAFDVGIVGPLAWAGLALFSLCHFGLLRRSARPGRLRAAVAFGFGLVHGFGFAGILMELELPPARLVPALFGFNVGVELGQLAIVAVAWPLLVLLARRAAVASRWLAETGSAAIFALGLFWLVARNF